MAEHRFVKGNKHGKGRPKLPYELVSAKEQLRVDFEKIVIRFNNMKLEDIALFVKEKKGTGLETAIASCLIKAITKGEHGNLGFFMDRIIGKPKQQVEVSGEFRNNFELSERQMIDMAKEVLRHSKEDEKTE